MIKIDQATVNQAERLFEIMVKATEVGCAAAYPPEIIAIWHKGRSIKGMAGAIAEGDIYALEDDGVIRGFVHCTGSEVLGLFVHPDDHRKGYGTALFRFAAEKLSTRPITIKATLCAGRTWRALPCDAARHT